MRIEYCEHPRTVEKPLKVDAVDQQAVGSDHISRDISRVQRRNHIDAHKSTLTA